MLDRKIKRIQRQLNKMILTEGPGSEKTLHLSQSLDVLIVEIMMQKACKHNEYFEAVQNVRSLKDNSKKGTERLQNGMQHESLHQDLHQGIHQGIHHDYTLFDLLHTPIRVG